MDPRSSDSRAKNPKRVAAGRRNAAKSHGLSPEGRERIRATTLAFRPWRFTTGPRTPEGKARSAANGKRRQKGALSVRELRAELTGERLLIGEMQATRQRLTEILDAPNGRQTDTGGESCG